MSSNHNDSGGSATSGGVVVNIQQHSRMYQIVATLLMCGAVGMLSFALAQNGWLELAATGLTMFMVQLGRLMLANGLLAIPKGAAKSSDFEGTKGFLQTAAAEFREWQARSPMWRLTALAVAYTLAFMVARWAMTHALTVFTNIWVAGALAAALASVIIFPSLVGDAVRAMKSKAAPVVPQQQPETPVQPQAEAPRQPVTVAHQVEHFEPGGTAPELTALGKEMAERHEHPAIDHEADEDGSPMRQVVVDTDAGAGHQQHITTDQFRDQRG